jgi:broad specificity phosphatase PhoE
VIFIESICTFPEILRENMLQKVRNSPDYHDMPEDVAMADLAKRVSNYEAVYETITEENLHFIKLINLRTQVICNRIKGHRAHELLRFLMCMHIEPRPIYLTRTGRTHYAELQSVHEQSETPLLDLFRKRIGLTVEAPLNDEGERYALKLAEFVERERATWQTLRGASTLNLSGEGPLSESKRERELELVVCSSTLPRAVKTAEQINGRQRVWPALNMLNTGILNNEVGLKMMQDIWPEGYQQWQQDPYRVRVPGGECYADVVHRLEPFVIELERTKNPVLVISHLSTLQVLMCYFTGHPVEKCTTFDIPLNSVCKLIPSNYGWRMEWVNIGVDSAQELSFESIE